MARPSQIDQQRRKLLLIVCQVFSERGYRRTTTAELARRCGVRENILYRLWPDKKAMFLAAIDDIFQQRADKWKAILSDRPGPQQAMQRLVAYEAEHQGEFGFYRIVFAALAEADDSDIRAALIGMYRGFHELVCRQIKVRRGVKKQNLAVDSAGWALLGLATMSNIVRELKLLPARQREKMFAEVAQHLVVGHRP